MNPLAGRLCTKVWHRADARWGAYIGPDPTDPADTAFVQWQPEGEPVRVDIEALLTEDHPSAGQVEEPGPDRFELTAGVVGQDEPTSRWWYIPVRRPENRRNEASAIADKWVNSGLADWAEVCLAGELLARKERSGR